MSLTEEAEMMAELDRGRNIRKHSPNFAGDGTACNRGTGHCSNTDSCYDCRHFQTTMEKKEMSRYFSPEK